MSVTSQPARVAAAVAVVCGAAVVVLLVVLIPWSPLPDGQRLVSVRPDRFFSASQLSRVRDFSGPQLVLSLTSYAVSLVVAGVLGLTSLGARLVDRLRGWWWVRVVVGTAAVLLIGAVVTLPFGLVMHARAVDVGLATQSVAGYLRDDAVGYVVDLVATSVALVALVGMARWLPRTWPFWAALLAGALVVLGSFVYPVVVEPLFNHFTRLPDGPLRRDVLTLASREHVHVDDVLVADASKRTTALNAYVTGFGATRRVVLYDTAVRSLPDDQLEAIVAHELGHAARDDVLTGTAIGAVAAGLGVGLLGVLISRPRLLRRAGASGPGDPRVLALVLALAAFGTFAASPVQNAASRAIEARADRSGLLATRDAPAFVAMQRRLDLAALSEPDPPHLVHLWFGTHPTTLERIGMASAMRNELR